MGSAFKFSVSEDYERTASETAYGGKVNRLAFAKSYPNPSTKIIGRKNEKAYRQTFCDH